MLDKKLKRLPILLIAASSVTNAWAQEQDINDSISFFCSKSDVTYQESVSVGKATQVNLKAGPFELVQSESDYQGAKYLIAEELLNAGVTSECAEFLVSSGEVKTYQDGDIFARVYFDYNRASLTAESRYILNSVVKKIKTSPANLLLEGHTDSTGAADYNFSLGLKRSESAKQYLVRAGMDSQLIKAVSKGETEPVATNSTDAGRELNRRVDLIKQVSN